jgi:hypothetical protein
MWPVLSGVCEWLESRVVKTDRGYELLRAMGIAEKEAPSDNEAFTAMSATVLLREAAYWAERLGRQVPPRWCAMAEGMVVPTNAGGDHVISYDGWRPNHEKGATPSPLAGLFPVGYDAGPLEGTTLRRYLELAPEYIGSPMLSSLYGVWAAWAGDRALSARLLDEGYAQFVTGRFHQTLEYRPGHEANQPDAGPSFANLAGYLSGLLLGFPGITPSAEDSSRWPRRTVELPAGWDAIEVERIWVRGQPASLVARQGARAELRQR